jgi:hypothetical protein
VTPASIAGSIEAIDPLTALGVLAATAATDAVYVMFSSAVAARRRMPAATWSSIWYLLSSFAVISYTQNWLYVAFAALGSWLGAYASMTYLHRPSRSRTAPPTLSDPAGGQQHASNPERPDHRPE